jgi:glycosyltransferase involved in cell wall biosynthesis
MKTIDIITSALNEEICLPEYFSRVTSVLSEIPNIEWRIIICDNGSTDATWEVIKEWTTRESRILGIQLSRNFNLDASLSCGLDHASADFAILMASDLQDPPELIHSLIREQEKGFDQVLVKIVKRDSVPFVYRHLSAAFYAIANRMTNGLLPRNVSDFRLLSKRAYESARQLREQNRFLRGLIAWTGYTSSIIEIERPPRFGGDSKFLQFRLSKVVHWAIKAILAHTTAPLIWVATLGLLFGALSVIATLSFSILWFFFGVPFAGFGTIVGIVTLGFSLVLLSLGILAQYIALIYEEVKNRPLYIIKDKTKI